MMLRVRLSELRRIVREAVAVIEEGHRADDFPPHPRRDAAMDELLRHVPPWIRVELPTAGESGRHRRNSPLNVQIEFTLGAQTAARRLESAPGEPGNALLKFMEDLIEDLGLEAQVPGPQHLREQDR
jgi:hypothetical protein